MPGSVKKYKLDIEDNIQSEIVTIGISTSESEIQLILELNQLVNVKLAFSEELKIIQRQTEHLFSLFRDFDEELEIQYVLLKNNSKQGRFTKEYAQIDFLFLLNGSLCKPQGEKVLAKIKNSPRVQTALILDNSKIKNLKSIPF